jgi:hypothetical protein
VIQPFAGFDHTRRNLPFFLRILVTIFFTLFIKQLKNKVKQSGIKPLFSGMKLIFSGMNPEFPTLFAVDIILHLGYIFCVGVERNSKKKGVDIYIMKFWKGTYRTQKLTVE